MMKAVAKLAKNLLLGETCTKCLKNSVCVRTSENFENNTCIDWESRTVYGKYIPITRCEKWKSRE